MSPLRRELAVVFGVFAAMLALSARQIRSEVLLSRHAQETQATVVSKQSHAWVGYTYIVAGITYEGSTPSTATGKSIDKVELGDKFTVKFDPSNPDVSGTTETREAIVSTVPFLVLVLVVAVGIVFVRNAVRQQRSVA